jgi:hypothetical protein
MPRGENLAQYERDILLETLPPYYDLAFQAWRAEASIWPASQALGWTKASGRFTAAKLAALFCGHWRCLRDNDANVFW